MSLTPRSPRRTAVSAAVVVVLACLHLASVASVPIAGGPREPLRGTGLPERWTPPRPHVDARFATFPVIGPGGEPGLWLPASSRIPIRFVVEQDVVDRFGLDELEAAIEVWNDVPGSRFGATIERVVDTDLDERFRDGVNRIFMDQRSCGGRYLARAHLWPGELVTRGGYATRYIVEFDLGLCDRLRPEDLETVIRHELLHMAGLDHLCGPGEPCHRPGMDDDNTCRIMSSRRHPCQEPTEGDDDGLVYLHPRLHRISGTDGPSISAAVGIATHPVPRAALQVVLTPEDAPLGLQAQAAALAGTLGVPHVLTAGDCTTGVDGRAIDHVLALAGRAQLVGDVARGCEASLQGAWSIPTERLGAAADVTARTVEVLPEPPREVVVVPAPEGDRTTPIAVVAAPTAVALGAPLIVLDETGDPEPVLDLVESVPSIERALIVSDRRQITTRAAATIAQAGVRVRRLPVTDAGDAAVALAGIAETTPSAQIAVAITAEERPHHGVAAIGLAAATGAVLLPVGAELRDDHAALLRDRVSRGVVIGDHQAVDNSRQMQLSRLVDS